MEHRSSTVIFQCSVWGCRSIWVHCRPICRSFSSADFLQLFFGLPRFRLPWGFQKSACLVMLLCGFLKTDLALISRPNSLHTDVWCLTNRHRSLIDFEFGRTEAFRFSSLRRISVDLTDWTWLVSIVYTTNSDTKSILLQAKKNTTTNPLNKYSMRLWVSRKTPRTRETLTTSTKYDNNPTYVLKYYLWCSNCGLPVQSTT